MFWYGLLVREVTRLQRVATGLIMFSLGSAVLAAAGRSHFAAGIELPVRYTMLVTPLHVGLLALLLDWIVDRPAGSWRSYVLAGGVGVGILLLAQQIVGARSAILVADSMRVTIDRYYAGERDAQIERLVYQNGLSKADSIVSGMRRDGLMAR